MTGKNFPIERVCAIIDNCSQLVKNYYTPNGVLCEYIELIYFNRNTIVYNKKKCFLVTI